MRRPVPGRDEGSPRRPRPRCRGSTAAAAAGSGCPGPPRAERLNPIYLSGRPSRAARLEISATPQAAADYNFHKPAPLREVTVVQGCAWAAVLDDLSLRCIDMISSRKCAARVPGQQLYNEVAPAGSGLTVERPITVVPLEEGQT